MTEKNSGAPKLLKKIWHWVTNLFSARTGILWSVPVIWALVASFRPANDALSRGDVWFSTTLTAENYIRAWSLAPFRAVLHQHDHHCGHHSGRSTGHDRAGWVRICQLRVLWQTLDLLLCAPSNDDSYICVAGTQLCHDPHNGAIRYQAGNRNSLFWVSLWHLPDAAGVFRSATRLGGCWCDRWLQLVATDLQCLPATRQFPPWLPLGFLLPPGTICKNIYMYDILCQGLLICQHNPNF